MNGSNVNQTPSKIENSAGDVLHMHGSEHEYHSTIRFIYAEAFPRSQSHSIRYDMISCTSSAQKVDQILPSPQKGRYAKIRIDPITNYRFASCVQLRLTRQPVTSVSSPPSLKTTVTGSTGDRCDQALSRLWTSSERPWRKTTAHWRAFKIDRGSPIVLRAE